PGTRRCKHCATRQLHGTRRTRHPRTTARAAFGSRGRRAPGASRRRKMLRLRRQRLRILFRCAHRRHSRGRRRHAGFQRTRLPAWHCPQAQAGWFGNRGSAHCRSSCRHERDTADRRRDQTNPNMNEARMDKYLTIADLKECARRRVPKMFFDYADSGAWTEGTYRANEEDFQKIKLRQRVLVDMTNRSLKTTMVGQEVSMPVALAPTGLTGMQHADGEMLAAQAAEEFGVPFTLSTMSICSIEDVASVTKKPFWFQLYVMRDRDF